MAQNVTGRHRAPGRFNAIAELKLIAKESAQPAVKGAAIVAASGGLVATFAGPASAADGSSTAAPSVVGPQVGTLKATNALSSIGYAKPAAKQATVKPVVIKDVKLEKERAAAKAAEDARQQAADRASRSASRVSLDPAPTASGIVGIAQSYFGVPYVYGGTSPSGFDCSGFVQYVYRQAGVSLPRTASQQQAFTTSVSNPRAGDLVFFGSPAYHVGIYVSPGVMIDAQRPGTTIGYHSIWTTPSGYGRA
ncbi:C40 family peptidase [Intrasporangium sp. YIM S08009]|uniref:C40 family peptidase n=1 Tax=Intrasporangium zincisolvens TaxID=3080018 RepID=UPI002B059BE7|nr:C40 family peptidase [Intrasporangium sp. YIM S08009]